MGNEFFLLILSLSLSGTLIAALVFAVKAVIRRQFSKKWQLYIWILVIARLLIPYSADINLVGRIFSTAIEPKVYIEQIGNETLYNQFENPEDYLEYQAGLSDGNILHTGDNSLTAPNMPIDDEIKIPKEQVDGSTVKSDLPKDDWIKELSEFLGEYLWLLWLFGVVLSLTVNLVDYYNFLRYIKINNQEVADEQVMAQMDDLLLDFKTKRDIKLYYNELAASPMLIGGFKPFIVLPSHGVVKEQLRFVLAHELMHYKHKDILFKWVFQLTMCIHWFNPLLIFVNRDINRSCELACDEAVMHYFGEAGRKEYSNVLLDVASNRIKYKNRVLSATLVENKKGLKERIVEIMNYKKVSKITGLYSVLLVGVLLASAVTAGAMTSNQNTEIQSGVFKEWEAVKLPVLNKMLENLVLGDTLTDALTDTLTDSSVSLGNWDNMRWNWGNDKNDMEADKVYGSDELIAGSDRSNQFKCRNFNVDNRKHQYKIEEFELNGSHTFWVVNSKENISMPIDYQVEHVDGKLKFCLIGPDKKVTVLQEGAGVYKKNVSLRKGRNIIKIVGKEADVTKLKLAGGQLDSKYVNGWYSCIEEEEAVIYTQKIENGGKLLISKFRKMAPYMDEKKVSKYLISLFESKTPITNIELNDIIPFVEEVSFSNYIFDYLKNGNQLTINQITRMAPFLDEKCVSQFLTSVYDNKIKLTEDEMIALLPFSDEDSLGIYFMNSVKSGNLNMSKLMKAAPFLDDSDVGKIFEDLWKSGVKVSDYELQELVPFVDEEYLDDYVYNLLKNGKQFTMDQINAIAPFLDETTVGKMFETLWKSGAKITEKQFNQILPFIDEDILGSYMREIVQSKQSLSSINLATIASYIDGYDLGKCIESYVDYSPEEALSALKTVSNYVDEDMIYSIMKKLINKDVKVNIKDLEAVARSMDNDDVLEIGKLLQKKGLAAKKEVENLLWYFD